MKVSIIGINKVDLLFGLYNNANCQGVQFDSNPMSKSIGRLSSKNEGDRNIAEKFIKESKDYIFDDVDLGAGSRPLKISLAGFEIDTTLYDEYHGNGQGQMVVDSIINDMAKDATSMTLDNIMEKVLDERQFAPENGDNETLAMIRQYVAERKKADENRTYKRANNSTVSKFTPL